MRAAAQLHRELADPQHAHLVLVLLAEQRHRTGGDGVVVVHQARLGGRIGADLGIDEPLDRGAVLRR
jgi:hypothetical protein